MNTKLGRGRKGEKERERERKREKERERERQERNEIGSLRIPIRIVSRRRKNKQSLRESWVNRRFDGIIIHCRCVPK